MGIIGRLFGAGKKQDGSAAAVDPEKFKPREGIPMGFNDDQPVLTITELGQEKIRNVLEAQDPPVEAIRVSSPFRGKYAMNIEPDPNPARDDTVLPFGGFQVLIDAESLPLVQGATLDYVETYGGGGFQFTNPNDTPKATQKKEPPAGPEGDVWRQIQEILDTEVNPAVAGHGGFIDLIDVQGGTVYVLMGGGCQGCGMANVTLKQGVERILKGHIPEIEEILDVTDHAGGRNPYYAPSTK
jgi:Fe/S biogenesis protein NfuA